MKASLVDGLERKPSLTEAEAIDAIVASQKANSEPIDPNGARKLVRALIAVGLFKPA